MAGGYVDSEHYVVPLPSYGRLGAPVTIKYILLIANPAVGQAFNRGYCYAQRIFEVNYLCSGGGRGDLRIETKEKKAAVAEFMSQQGWHDPRCR